MSIKKRIAIGVGCLVLVVAVAVTAVLAASSYTVTSNASVGYSVGTNKQCTITVTYQQYNGSTDLTGTANLKTNTFTQLASATGTTGTAALGACTFSASTYTWKMTITVTNTGSVDFACTFAPASSTTNLTAATATYSSGFSNGGNLEGSSTVGDNGGTATMTQVISIKETSRTKTFSTEALSWSVSAV